MFGDDSQHGLANPMASQSADATASQYGTLGNGSVVRGSK
jgi:hypothetical protein